MSDDLERLRQRLTDFLAAGAADRSNADRLHKEFAAVREVVERAEAEASQARRELSQVVSTNVVALCGLREEIERIESSTAWRVGHRVARVAYRARGRRTTTDGAVAAALDRVDQMLARLQSGTGRLDFDPPSSRSQLRVPRLDRSNRISTAAQRQLAADLRSRLGPPPQRGNWPGVSVLVVNRDGEALLPRLLTGLAATDYPKLELIVIDNASSDHSVQLLETAALPFPLRVEFSAPTSSFAAANNQAASAARHPLLLMLNNDVEPFESGWLKELVHALLSSDAVAMSSTLLRTDPMSGRPQRGPLVQHRGICLERAGALAQPRNMGGENVSSIPLGREVACVAGTAACLLTSGSFFHRIGGLDTSYYYGLEDMAFACRALRLGSFVGCSGRAVLFHEEGATQEALGREFRRFNHSINHRLLAEHWGPVLRRELRLGLSRLDPAWVDGEALHAGIVSGTRERDTEVSRAFANALEALHWRISWLDNETGTSSGSRGGLDVVFSLTDRFDARDLPAHVTAVGWINGEDELWPERPWLDRYDVLATGSKDSLEVMAHATGRRPTFIPSICAVGIRDLVLESETNLSFCLKVGAPNWEIAARGGDLYLARALQRALKRRGHRSLIQVRSEWEDIEGFAHDVVVHIRGRGTYMPRRGQLNVMWLISHPRDLVPAECDAYDLVCVASHDFAAYLRDRTSTPVEVLEQATDPWWFRPTPTQRPGPDVVFVGNTRGVNRGVVVDLASGPYDLAVWGAGWEGLLDRPQLRGGWLANDELRRVYSSAKIVLCDHWDDMRSNGFVSNRVYDAVACGAVVVCDDVRGLDSRFGGAVTTYRSSADLRALVGRLVGSPMERERRAADARARILAAHTFDHRAADLVRFVDAQARAVGYSARFCAPEEPT